MLLDIIHVAIIRAMCSNLSHQHYLVTTWFDWFDMRICLCLCHNVSKIEQHVKALQSLMLSLTLT